MIVNFLHTMNVTYRAKLYPEAGKTDTNRKNEPEFARGHNRATLGFPMKIIKQNETSIPPLRIWTLKLQKTQQKRGICRDIT